MAEGRCEEAQMRVLGVGAHPDDLEVMHIGALTSHANRWTLVLTDGGAGTVKGFSSGRSLCLAATS
jgi:LmbE family N-acetylglucosaminyl deacetylase